jgi:hypothetical protein
MTQHARLAPSAASRWTTCTASVSLIEENKDQLPPDSSSYAEEGTLAHEWASNILNGLADLSEVPEEEQMQEAVGAFVNLAQRLTQPEDEVFIERAVPLFYSPEETGTVDFALISETRLYVLDYKHGVGVDVQARNNKQLAIYTRSLVDDLEGSGLYEFPDGMLVTMGIVQPRSFHSPDEPVKLWVVTVAELKMFTDNIAQTAGDIALFREHGKDFAGWEEAIIFDPEAEGACQFCPAKGFCKARAEYLSNPMAFNVFENLDPEETEQNEVALAVLEEGYPLLTPEQVVAIVSRGKEFIKWVQDVMDSAQAALAAGQEIPGLKLVKGREGNRNWADETAAAKLVAKYIPAGDRFTKKLKSVAQVEKLLKPHEKEFSTRFKNRFAELVTRGPAKDVLALAEDPREAVNIPKAQEVFEVETLGEEEDPLA